VNGIKTYLASESDLRSDGLPRKEETPAGQAARDPSVKAILDEALYKPVLDLFERPSKMIRAKMVEAGYQLAGETNEKKITSEICQAACAKMAEALEAIHAGSLIVDDVQDGSKERRGQPSLHERYGVPLAINAGNWLYFEPLSWIRKLDLPEAVELRLYRLCHESMLNAHVGQAIDIGARIEECEASHVRAICMSSLKLKTGALTTLALASGATLGGASEKRVRALAEFGERFGVALQMFDDIGNFNLPSGHPKRMEDFRLRRPTWLWAVAADNVSAGEYADFVNAVCELPNELPLLSWMSRTHFLALARKEAEGFLKESMALLELEIGSADRFPSATGTLHELAERIRTSYG
jgi:geranylgeranyl pyrophosphate synthase